MKNSVKRQDDILNTPQVDPNSTWLNPGIKTLKDLKDWVLIKLGYPLISVELTDQQLNSCVADAIALYSKYAYVPARYLTVNLKYYIKGKGIDLSEFNIMQVKKLGLQRDNIFGMQNDMFFGPYAFMGQGQGGPMFGMGNGNSVGSWVTYHNITEWFKLTERMTGSNPDFFYDKSTKILKLMPEPHWENDHYILLECYIEPPLEEYYGNEYVRRLVLAEAKILLGTIRKKFSSVQLIGGGNIDTSIGDEGKTEKDTILQNIINDESIGQCFYIS